MRFTRRMVRENLLWPAIEFLGQGLAFSGEPLKPISNFRVPLFPS